MNDCLFCKIAGGELPADLVYEDETVVAFNDINPQAPIHFLVIPRRHIAMIADMEASQSGIIGRLFHVAAEVCREKKITDYRLVINNGKGAGQAVFHVHLHVLAGRPFGWPPG